MWKVYRVLPRTWRVAKEWADSGSTREPFETCPVRAPFPPRHSDDLRSRVTSVDGGVRRGLSRTRVTTRRGNRSDAPLRVLARKGADAGLVRAITPRQWLTTDVWSVVMLQSSGLIRPRASLRCR